MCQVRYIIARIPIVCMSCQIVAANDALSAQTTVFVDCKHVTLCTMYRVPIYITSLGAREDIYSAAHANGGVVLHDIINNAFAQKAVAKGADGLVAVAAGAAVLMLARTVT